MPAAGDAAVSAPTRRAIARAALALVLSAAACRGVLGLDERRHVDDVCGGVRFGDETCGVCVVQACCDALAACQSEPDCARTFTCIAACAAGDDACRRGCRADYPTGFGDALAGVLACQASACSPACDLPCGGYVYPDEACAACEPQCCDQATACASDAECLALAFCARSCETDADPNGCKTACKAAHLAGGDAASAHGRCLTEACPSACGDNDWWCLDHPTTFPPQPEPRMFGVIVADPTRGAVVVGATVKVCAPADADCSDPLVVSTVAGNGEALVEVPAHFAGYFELSAPGYTTTLHYPRLDYTTLLADSMPLWPEDFTSEAVGAIASLDPARGIAVMGALGCTGAHTAGVSFHADASGTSTGYLREGTFSVSAASTDLSGLGAIVNLPPGNVTLRGEVDALGRTLDERTVVVRPATITDFPLRPVGQSL